MEPEQQLRVVLLRRRSCGEAEHVLNTPAGITLGSQQTQHLQLSSAQCLTQNVNIHNKWRAMETRLKSDVPHTVPGMWLMSWQDTGLAQVSHMQRGHQHRGTMAEAEDGPKRGDFLPTLESLACV